MFAFGKLYKKIFCISQWNIGLCRSSLEEIIRQRKKHLSINWFPLKDYETSVADPFVFKTPQGEINILYEDFSMVNMSRYGTIRLMKLNERLEPAVNKEVLDTKSHLSYPFVYIENGKTYVIPESKHARETACYQYNFENDSLINKKVLIDNLPLLDSTIVKHNNKYWLFATMGGEFQHSKLYIYYADELLGAYKPHKKNPVKYSLQSARPAGNFFYVDGALYRPSQNCKAYYGKSIVINKVIKLTEDEFEETNYLELTQQRGSRFSDGMHTINAAGDVIIVDGIRLIFDPMLKLKLFLKKRTWRQ